MPIVVLRTITHPKVIGDMPAAVTIGKSSGDIIKIIGMLSTTHPKTSSITLQISSIMIGLSVRPVTNSTNLAGTPAMDKNFANAVAVPSMKATIPLKTIASFRLSYKIFRVRFLYTKNPINIAYTTATAADSVGVKIPV